jgi:hypothetical protein
MRFCHVGQRNWLRAYSVSLLQRFSFGNAVQAALQIPRLRRSLSMWTHSITLCQQ